MCSVLSISYTINQAGSSMLTLKYIYNQYNEKLLAYDAFWNGMAELCTSKVNSLKCGLAPRAKMETGSHWTMLLMFMRSDLNKREYYSLQHFGTYGSF